MIAFWSMKSRTRTKMILQTRDETELERMLQNLIKTRTKIKRQMKIFSRVEVGVILVTNHSKGRLQTLSSGSQGITLYLTAYMDY